MSAEKSRAEAQRWISQANADLRAAKASRAAGSREWACFECQRAGDKALKAVWLANQHDPWGHSAIRLIEDYPQPATQQRLRALLEHARLLDKLCIPTRYPNGLPELTPAEVYGETDSVSALSAAGAMLREASAILGAEWRGHRSPAGCASRSAAKGTRALARWSEAEPG